MQTTQTQTPFITLHQAIEKDFFEVKHFLKRHKQSSVQAKDTVFIVRLKAGLSTPIIGLVKLEHIELNSPHPLSNKLYWLKGLYIENQWRSQGYASQLLYFMAQQLQDISLSTTPTTEIVAFPLQHLESFYLKKGYQPIKPSTLPTTLHNRYQNALTQQKNWLCMSLRLNRKALKNTQ